MEENEINLNKIKSDELLEVYNNTKEFIEFLDNELKEVEEKNA